MRTFQMVLILGVGAGGTAVEEAFATAYLGRRLSTEENKETSDIRVQSSFPQTSVGYILEQREKRRKSKKGSPGSVNRDAILARLRSASTAGSNKPNGES